MALTPPLVLALFALGCILLWLPVAIPQLLRIGWRPGRPLVFSGKLQLILSLYLVIALVLWATSAWLGVPFGRWGLRGGLAGWGQLAAGLGLGALGLAILFAVEMRAGWLRLQPVRLSSGALFAPLAVGLFVGAVEEVLFRGFVYETLLPYGPGWAAVVSSLIFAALHLIWQLDDWQGGARELPGLFAMGLVLVLARLLSGGSIHLAWGLHAGWVWGITLIDTHTLAVPTGKTATWVTGFGGKPLAGAMGLAFLGATALVLWGLGPPPG
ncbi:CPBP family intramembrane glutamic endopeptidase [Gloeobacter violaceus]|uniref:CPBP family intramembrane glutamic endopeptidase n=1 Tax=Gloeobacter violaceus TaxID=33072 RepID=UPI0013E8D455|nr:type II CAAX endopeptidase family protein [Gloeobacter violaceus]